MGSEGKAEDDWKALPPLLALRKQKRSTQSTWKRTCFHAMRRPGCKPRRAFRISLRKNMGMTYGADH